MEITHVSIKPGIQRDIDRMMRSLHYFDFPPEKLFSMMLLLVNEFEHRSAILAADDRRESLPTFPVEKEVRDATVIPFRPRSLQPVLDELLDESGSQPTLDEPTLPTPV